MTENLMPCRTPVSDGAGGQTECGTLSTLRCAGCDSPVCAACSEDSWLDECAEHCPECWDQVPEVAS